MLAALAAVSLIPASSPARPPAPHRPATAQATRLETAWCTTFKYQHSSLAGHLGYVRRGLGRAATGGLKRQGSAAREPRLQDYVV